MAVNSNNNKLLSAEEYKLYKERYSFVVFEDQIAVKVKGFNRVTLHPMDEKFSINALVNKKPYRKVTFTPEAMHIWKDLWSENKDYHLIDIQQAVSKLHITFQVVNKDNVLSILQGKDIRIRVDDII